MKRTGIIFFIFLILFTSVLIAQYRNHSNSAFLSGMVGTAKVNFSGDDNRNPMSLAFGGSFGIPIVKNLFLYARTSYTSQTNFQSYYNSSYLTGGFRLSEEFTEVNASFTQLLLNGGLLYNFRITEDFNLGVNGGATFMIVNQEAKLKTGHVISSVDNENIWGAFGGIIAEKSWDDSDFSTFFEAQYNYAKSDALYRSDVLNIMNYTFGVRYYLSGR